MPKTEITINGIVYEIDKKHQTACVFGITKWDLPNVVIAPYISEGNRQYPVTSIGDKAFEDCFWLTSVTIPDNVKSIGEWAFAGCIALISIILPDSVTSIGEKAFYCCWELTSVNIPNSVIKIGDMAFKGCANLTSIIVEDGNRMYDSRNGCNAIIETATNTLIAGCRHTLVPESVTSIKGGAFDEYKYNGPISISLPESIKSIGEMLSMFDVAPDLPHFFSPRA